MNRKMGLLIHPASVTLTRVPFDSGANSYVHVPPNAPPALGSICVTIFRGGDDSSTISGTSKPPPSDARLRARHDPAAAPISGGRDTRQERRQYHVPPSRRFPAAAAALSRSWRGARE